MASAKPRDLPRTLAAFNRWHARQPERWEFIFGVPVMMAPARNAHSLIKGNIYRHLANRLAGSPCVAMVDGPEVQCQELSAIPDVVVTCSEIDEERGRIPEPTLIVEVTSPSSERDDTLRKWQGYCLIPSLRHYLIVSQEARFAMLHSRVGAFEWSERVVKEGEIDFVALSVAITIDEIYAGVTSAAAGPDA